MSHLFFGFSLWVTLSLDFLSPPSLLCLWQIAPALGTGDSGSLTGWPQLETKEMSSRSNDWYKALTELVQLSAYRGRSHRRLIASSHIFYVPEAFLLHFTYRCWFLNGARFARCHFRAPKSLDFQGRPFPMTLKLYLHASKSLIPDPYKQQVH